MTSHSPLLNIKFPDFLPIEIMDIKHSQNTHMIAILLSNRSIQILDDKSFKVLRWFTLSSSLDPIKIFFSILNTLIVITSNGMIYIYALHDLNNPISTLVIDCDGILNADYQAYSIDSSDELCEMISVCGKDGSVHMYTNNVQNLQENPEETHYLLHSIVYNINEKKTAALCCEFSNPQKAVFVGYQNGRVKKYNAKNGNGVCWNSKVAEEFLVFAVKVFNNDFLVIGGSDGRVFVLDCKFGAIIQSFANASVADVTVFALDSPNELIYFTGFDSRIFLLKFDSVENEFKLLGRNRGQTHEVNSLLIYRNGLLSGGKTSDLCLMKIGKDGFLETEVDKKKHFQQSLPSLIFHAGENLLGYFFNDQIFVVKFENKTGDFKPSVLINLHPQEQPNQIAFSAKTGILVVSINSLEVIRFYQISSGELIKEISMKCVKILVQKDLLFIIEHNKNAIKVLSLSDFSVQNYSLDSLELKISKQTIDVMEVSPNRNYCLIWSVLESRIIVVNLKNSSVTDLSFLCKGKKITNLKFVGSSDKLFYLTNNYKMGIYQISKQVSFSPTLKSAISSHVGVIKEVVFKNSDANKLLLSSDYYLVNVDLTDLTVKIIKKENPSLFFGYLNNETLFTLFVDWKEAIQRLQSPVFTKKFVDNN